MGHFHRVGMAIPVYRIKAGIAILCFCRVMAFDNYTRVIRDLRGCNYRRVIQCLQPGECRIANCHRMQ